MQVGCFLSELPSGNQVLLSARQKPLVVCSMGAGCVTVTFSVLQASVE